MEEKIQLLDVAKVDSISLMGLGTMGMGWATALLQGGFKNIYAFELNEAVREPARAEVLKRLKRAQDKGNVSEGFDANEAILGLHLLATEEAVCDTDAPIFLEIIPEKLKLKCEIFARVGEQLPVDTVVWTNTSCLNVEKMGSAYGRPGMFVGTHGMNPVNLTKCVEIVEHDLVNPDVLAWTIEIIKKIGKVPVKARNFPGFIVNRIFMATAFSAVQMLARGEAGVKDIDDALRLSLGHPQGMFLLLDYIGIDVMVDVGNELHLATGDPRYAVPDILQKMVTVRNLGTESRRGFYDWTDPKNPQPLPLDQLAISRLA